jgi:hypothetical protein
MSDGIGGVRIGEKERGRERGKERKERERENIDLGLSSDLL